MIHSTIPHKPDICKFNFSIRSILAASALFLLLSSGLVLAGENVSEDAAVSGEPDLENIVERARLRQMEILEKAGDAVFVAESIYREKKKDGGLKKEVVTRKRVYTRGFSKRHDEYLSMSINGRKLSKEEMEEELEDDGKDDDKMRMPLTPEGEGAYNFRLVGSDNLNGVDVWIIEFSARKKDKKYVNGKGYISKDTCDIIRTELAPAKISRLVKDLKVCVTSACIQGYWMPVKFEIDVKVKLSFLYYKHITIEETYSDFRLNNKFDDSIFELE